MNLCYFNEELITVLSHLHMHRFSNIISTRNTQRLLILRHIIGQSMTMFVFKLLTNFYSMALLNRHLNFCKKHRFRTINLRGVNWGPKAYQELSNSREKRKDKHFLNRLRLIILNFYSRWQGEKKMTMRHELILLHI